MFSAKKTAVGLAITTLMLGVAYELANPVESSKPQSFDSVQVASRYHLRSRTPSFFGRSKTSTSSPAPKAPAQPVVRRG